MKVFSLRAEVVERELMRKSHMGPARKMDAWEYNGSVPGPMIEVVEGDRARVIFNLGMDHRPIHLHGVQFYVTGAEGGRIPGSAWRPGYAVIVGVAQARDVEFEAKYVGDWMLHWRLPRHTMNQMSRWSAR